MSRARRNGQPVPAPELPWSWHKSPGWQGQFARVCRWYKRIQQAKVPSDIEDYLYAFFQNCFHLREWLQEARVVPQASIEQLFRDNEELRLCQDIANATKHRSLVDPKQSREFSLARVYVGESHGWFESDTALVVLSEGNQHDALELAGRCLELWENLLDSNGLCQRR